MLTFDLEKLSYYDEITKTSMVVPYGVVYKKENKTLIYCTVKRGTDVAHNFIDYMFDKYRPEVAVVEYEQDKKMPISKCKHEAVYTALKASAENIPVLFADKGFGFSAYNKLLATAPEYATCCKVNTIVTYMSNNKHANLEDAVFEFNQRAKRSGFPIANLNEIKQFLESEYGKDPMVYYSISKESKRNTGKKLNTFLAELNKRVRDPFFVLKVEEALKLYDVVLVVANLGRHMAQIKLLENTFGPHKEYHALDDAKGAPKLDLAAFINK